MDSLVAGGVAGLVVDLTLYPIDTIKTRLQSRSGFYQAGGFRGVYKGLSAVAIGSVPGGAAFFVGYDLTKRALLDDGGENNLTTARRLTSQAVAAMAGETLACLTRVPTEMVKQQLQAGHHHDIYRALSHITHNIPPDAASVMAPRKIRWLGLPLLFTGMPIMLLREWPFSIVQMCCYEGLKACFHTEERPQYLPLCGALSGGTAAFLTTPLDVLKTRIMLGQVGAAKRTTPRGTAAVRAAFHDLLCEMPRATDKWGGAQRFFRGAVPRVIWISIGGSVFFTTYETVWRGYHWATTTK
ncbi:putative mitochondrial carrier protein [Trypanosoma cruzi]|uniref:Mitochondrial carrier protein, putative n=2 Tax=Trypanosoma cruzi TaxID=5693 RepID=Q4DK22_TRYCC|nr:mitochondrial carrier protein, putative [Trypanosoma cruzi]EAN92880.1 mitochondrial carrier protein, putative [Trypanosoma cruzi]PWV21541.1 putative mitochondrial carrier protein [Trypanosoma cruzi]RNC58962.1 mitochondrial carrier protein [Trypanosoma cruzi]|eukprot:XP_814731.1 mitochondrial carrier protein [Trypanosoma cruzi strain CL Brener]